MKNVLHVIALCLIAGCKAKAPATAQETPPAPAQEKPAAEAGEDLLRFNEWPKWALVPMGSEGSGYSNFAWRINVDTGEVSALRTQHSDEDGWSLDVIVLDCTEKILDRMARGEKIDREEAMDALKNCAPPSKEETR